MWKCDSLKESITEYINSNLIDEIIIIDNDPDNKFELPTNNKIKYLTKGYNIFVNPSWNWAVDVSKNNNLIISNDDIYIKKIDNIIKNFFTDYTSIVGLDYEKINKNCFGIERSIGNMRKGFGCFFFLNKKKYIKIPDEFKIFYGDVILYNTIPNRYTFFCDDVNIKMSVTSSNYSIVPEKQIWKKKYKNIYNLT